MTEPNQVNDSGLGASSQGPANRGAGEPASVDEFAGIEPAPPRRSPILALVIIGLSLGTTYHLREDLRYALSPRTPVPLGELRGAGQAYEGRYVSVRGIPDRRNALYVETRGDKTRESFFRLLDADPPLFVRARDTSLSANLAPEWKGRLRRYADVSYATSLREYLARGVQISRGIELASLRGALATPASDGLPHLRDRRGRELRLAGAAAPIEIETRPADYLLELPRDKYPKLADAERELARVTAPFGLRLSSMPQGLAGLAEPQDDPEVFKFWTPLLESELPRRNQLFAALEAAGVEFSLAHPRLTRKLEDLGYTQAGEALTVKGSALTQPFADVVAATVSGPLELDDDVLVLAEGETPAGYLWAPLVAALLLALAAFNAWYLLRPRRAA